VKALVLTEERTLALVDRPEPTCTAPDDVVVRVRQTGICGTDRGVLLGKFPAEAGVIMGHEAVGWVAEIGAGVTTVKAGDRVIVNPTLYCGQCDRCRSGQLNFCANKTGNEIGLDRDGSFAEFIRIEERFLHAVPDGMDFDRAVLVEPLACVLNNLDAARLQPGDSLIVLGAGPIGVVVAMTAAHFGHPVTLVEPDPLRRRGARDVLGDPVRVAAPEEVDGQRAQVVIDTVGSLLEAACELATDTGTVVIMGFDDRAVAQVRPLRILQRGLTIVGAGDYNSLNFPRAVLLARHLPLERLITHRVPLEEYASAIDAVGAGQEGRYAGLKVLIEEPSPGHPEEDLAPDASISLPPSFTFGAATSAYQIEGAVRAGGRGASIWDTFSAEPGRVHDGHTGTEAIDHYHRYRSDVALMASLNLNAYRFSIAWPRVQPTGRGPVVAAGLDFYDRLTDELLSRGIRPMPTLYHWDLPQPLQDAGGWGNRDTAARFADYAALVTGRLGDRVDTFLTVNEPWCAAFLGHASGVHAPGRTDPGLALAAAHHLLLGHGLAATAIRGVSPVRVGLALNPAAVRPASDDPADMDAVRRIDGLANRLFLDPLRGAGYPADVVRDLAAITDWGFVRPGDENIIGSGVDVLGVNYYTPTLVAGGAGPGEERQDGHGGGPSPWPGCADIRMLPAPGPRTTMGWPIDASGLEQVLHDMVRHLPGTPLVVAENGASFDDVVGPDSRVHDDDRVGYLRTHLAAISRAAADGVPVEGYYLWSLFDNFEWQYGYSKRFGIVHVNFETQARTVKDSGRWYSSLIARHRSPAAAGA